MPDGTWHLALREPYSFCFLYLPSVSLSHEYTGLSVFTQVPQLSLSSAGVEAFWGMIGGAARRDGRDWLDTAAP